MTARKLGLVFAGGGARGFAHAGVLRALRQSGCEPSVMVGVSMGAVVAATFALNPDWYVASVHSPCARVDSVARIAVSPPVAPCAASTSAAGPPGLGCTAPFCPAVGQSGRTRRVIAAHRFSI